MRKKEKFKKPKMRIPVPPPQKPHSTKKGKRGYRRQKAKRAAHIIRKEAEMSGMYAEGVMAKEARRQDAQDAYFNAIRNLSVAQITLVVKWVLSLEEEKEISASALLTHAREKFREYLPYMNRWERPRLSYF